MVILIDTNIILDYLLTRQPFSDNADKILNLCLQQKCNGYIAAHSVTNIFLFFARITLQAKEKRC
jgi:predicted nucleic acid-binding protein